jgi:hypothetical protein
MMRARTRGTWVLCGIACLLTALTGCIVVHPGGPHGPQCPPIEAATKIHLSSDRLNLLGDIAVKPHLTQHEQTYLVRAVLYAGVGGQQADVLVRLIHNPSCTEQTRREISAQLELVSYNSGRKRIAEALRETAASAPAPE